MNRLFLRNRAHRPLYVFSLVILVISMTQQVNGLMPASQDTRWSTPQNMPVYDPSANPPILIADQNRKVHAFSSQWVGDADTEPIRSIVYNEWTLEGGWTNPVDIFIMSPDDEIRLTDVYLDDSAMLHILFFGGDNTRANIYYSKAPVALASDARAWSAPLIVGERAADPEVAVFAMDYQGALNVVYTGRDLGNGLYVVKSSDGGDNWTGSAPIFFATNNEPNISQLEIIEGESGWLHALWGVFNLAGQGRGVYYSGSKDGNNWSEPVLLAIAQDELGTQKPTIIESKDTLFALYITSIKLTMRRSYDEGQTWDNPSVIFPRHIGMNGLVSMVIDGNNDLHLFFGQRIPGNPDIHGMWHSMFIENRWIEPEAIVKGPRIADKEGDAGFDPNYAQAVVSQGNVILVTWRTDPASKPNGIWYSYKKIAAPELPVVEPPLAIDSANTPDFVTDLPLGSTPIAAASKVSSQAEVRPIPVPTDRAVFLAGPTMPVYIGSISALILIMLVAMLIRANRSK